MNNDIREIGGNELDLVSGGMPPPPMPKFIRTPRPDPYVPARIVVGGYIITTNGSNNSANWEWNRSYFLR